jgi:hypothetical protein
MDWRRPRFIFADLPLRGRSGGGVAHPKNNNAWPLAARQAMVGVRAFQRLRLGDFFSPLELLRLLVLALPRARSLGAGLVLLPALASLLEDSERLVPPLEDFGLRAAIESSLK